MKPRTDYDVSDDRFDGNSTSDIGPDVESVIKFSAPVINQLEMNFKLYPKCVHAGFVKWIS